MFWKGSDVPDKEGKHETLPVLHSLLFCFCEILSWLNTVCLVKVGGLMVDISEFSLKTVHNGVPLAMILFYFFFLISMCSISVMY